jgi:hypothetical protein
VHTASCFSLDGLRGTCLPALQTEQSKAKFLSNKG